MGNGQDWGALGRARLADVAAAASQDEWKQVLARHEHAFPFTWGTCWKATIEYQVADFPAEIGFFLDALGFESNAFGPEYCMLTPPDRAFFFSVRPVRDGEQPTPPSAIRIGFMVEDIQAVATELEARGIAFTEPAAPHGAADSPMWRGAFATPGGIPVELWGMVKTATLAAAGKARA